MIGYKTLAQAQQVSFEKIGRRSARILIGGRYAAMGLRLDPIKQEWRETIEGPDNAWEYYTPAKLTL